MSSLQETMMPAPSSRLRLILSSALLLALVVAGLLGGGGQAQESNWLNPGPATPHPAGPEIPPEISDFATDWPAPMGNLAGTRAALNSPINASNVAQLEVAWTFPVEAPGAYGGMTAPPVVVGETIYIQDQNSNVFALDRASGEVKWERRYESPTIGPNGVAVGYGMVYASLGPTSEFVALSADTGEEVWRVDLSENPGEGIDMAPVVYNNTVYVSTVPGTQEMFYRGGARGILYALDVSNGDVLWSFDTTTDNLWGNPRVNSGGGLWYPLSIDEAGNLYFGTGNPGPWPGIEIDGTPYPNGSTRPGPNDYTNSMVSLDSRTGALRWYYNAKPHDLFDLDFQITPIIATIPLNGSDTKIAIGAGKSGDVVAANAETGEVLWETPVGIHQNDDLQEIPLDEVTEVYPGSLGGVETPMAYANGTVFVPYLNLPSMYTGLTQEGIGSFNEATGGLVALNAADGSVKWEVDLPQMNLGSATVSNDIVFTSAMDGIFRAYNVETGELVWSYQAQAGMNAPPSIAGDLLLVPATAPLLTSPVAPEATPGGPAGFQPATPAAEQPGVRTVLIAFQLPSGEAGGATPTS
jgi:glucose dehydrogenase